MEPIGIQPELCRRYGSFTASIVRFMYVRARWRQPISASEPLQWYPEPVGN
jgi:hypothetical protein